MKTLMNLVPAEKGHPGLDTIRVAGKHRPKDADIHVLRDPDSQDVRPVGLPHYQTKLVCRNFLRNYAADRKSEGLQVADLLKKAVKDFLAVATMPSQWSASPPQEKTTNASLPGPSTGETSHTMAASSVNI